MPNASTLHFQAGEPETGLFRARTEAGGEERVAFVAPAGSGEPLPSRLSLAECWGIAGGAFLFLGAPVEDERRLVGGVRALLAGPELSGARLLWIGSPASAPERWEVTAVRVARPTAEGGELGTLALFAFRNYGVTLVGGCSIALDDGVPGFRVSPPEELPNGIFLTVDGVRVRPVRATGPARIALAGPEAGCLSLPLAVGAAPAAGSGERAAVDLLDVGCRFFHPDRGAGELGSLDSLRYPLFDTSRAGFALRAVLDPLSPRDAARTRMEFDAGGPSLPSFYATPLGHRVELRPLAGSRLVFAPRAVFPAPVVHDPFYLVPDGPFGVVMVDDGARDELLCGILGTEYVGTEGAEARLAFVAGQPAYTPAFDPAADEPPVGAEPDAPLLSAEATTSWAAVTSPTARLPYFAQPVTSTLYGGATAPAGGTSLLPFFPVVAADLPKTVSGEGDRDGELAGTAYPLLPYRGVDDAGLLGAKRFETRYVSPERRRILHALNARVEETTTAAPAARTLSARALAGADAGPRQRAATPQGLLADFSAGGRAWERLLVARSSTERGPQDLAFHGIRDPLRSALLTPQQFVVISDARRFAEFFGGKAGDATVSIAGWEFPLDPAQWQRQGTVVVIKNRDRSLRELAEDLSQWVLAKEFNASPAATQTRLRQILRDAAEKARPATGKEGDPDFAFFADTVAGDARWNGILFLNCHLPPTAVPPELEALAAGIDPERFGAHHVGVNQTPITGGELEMQPSSMFGLIHYEDTGGGEGPGDYDFRVRSLKVRFSNSQVESFSSRISVTMKRVFDTPSSREVWNARDEAWVAARKADGSPDPTLVLEGTYQRQGDHGTYVFASEQPNRFVAQGGGMLQSVRIGRTQFDTVSSGGEGPDAKVVARFSFWGSLEFRALEWHDDAGRPQPFDLFSYDELAYSALALEMSFPHSRPRDRTFRFDVGGIAFDALASKARPGSLATSFPTVIKGVQASDGKTGPDGVGFMPLDTPVELDSVDPKQWFALLYDLDLGSAGALAAGAGIVATLGVAWSPGQERRAFVGLKLPFSGGKTIGIQGVLGLEIYSLQLLQGDGSFLLKLNGITLSFFGKTLPPGASFDFFVFGDPDGQAGSGSLGWYGAYKKDPPPKKEDDDSPLGGGPLPGR